MDEDQGVNWRHLGTRLRIGGHRGDPASAPENTLAAFAAAIESGADYIETDVHRTADGVLVLIHDDSVDRTTNGSGLVYELRSTEVLALDAGSWFAPRFAGERIPRLDEFLDWITRHQRTGVMLEAKPYGTGADLARAVERSKARDRTCIVSFLPEELRAAKQVTPEVPCYLLFDARPGIDIVDLILAFELDGADVPLRWMNEDFVGRMHSAGLAVIGSTADDATSIEGLVRVGADFVDTNDPRLAVAARDRRV